MQTRVLLQLIFGFIFLSLLACTSWASLQQPLWEWQGLTSGEDRWWSIATLIDAYYGFLTFYVWVWFKEPVAAARALWFVAIMTLGNMAMSAYVLRELARLRDDEPVTAILLPRQRPR